MKELEQHLQKIGLSDKEAAVYTSIILGAHTPQDILVRTQISRGSMYRAIEELQERGLITQNDQEGERLFLLEPAERIISMLDGYKRDLEEKSLLAQQLVKQVRAFQSKEETVPIVRYIEGKQELRDLQKEYEWRGEDIIQISGYDVFMALYEEELAQEHRKSLSQKPGHIRSILVTNQKLEYPEELNIDFVILPPSMFPIEGEMSVSGDRVLLFSYAQDISAIEIQSKAIADTLRTTLELAWQTAKQLEGETVKR